MNRNDYFPHRAADQIVWLQNFRYKIVTHSAALEIEAATWVGEAQWLIYVMGAWLPAQRAYQKACTQAANLAKTGTGTAQLVLPMFTPPALPDGVTARPPGGLDRIFKLVARIKQADAYTMAMGTDLGVIGSGKTPPDPATLRPMLGLSIVGERVVIDWGWDGFSDFLDQLEIQVDRGAGWTVLTFDTTPGYTDGTPFPDTPTRWKYRAIWRVDDEPIGQWSPEAAVIVG